MKIILLALLSFTCGSIISQSYRENVSFKADLWLIQKFEEGTYQLDTSVIAWEDRKVKKAANVIYVDASQDQTMIHIKYPKKMTLTSEGLAKPRVRKFGEHTMYIASYARDTEDGYLYRIVVGKDARWEDEKHKDDGRIYLVIEDPARIRPSWYFVIKVFGKK
jgi:hypothetical protein